MPHSLEWRSDRTRIGLDTLATGSRSKKMHRTCSVPSKAGSGVNLKCRPGAHVSKYQYGLECSADSPLVLTVDRGSGLPSRGFHVCPAAVGHGHVQRSVTGRFETIRPIPARPQGMTGLSRLAGCLRRGLGTRTGDPREWSRNPGLSKVPVRKTERPDHNRTGS